MENPLNIMLIGASGRLGKAIESASLDLPSFRIKEKITSSSPHLSNISTSDIVLDVSLAGTLEENLKIIIDAKKPFVIGSTGHSPKMVDLIKEAAKEIPIFFCSNFSPGIALLKNFLKANRFASSASISETHHEMKKDAPSGTAKELASLTSTPHEHIEVVRTDNVLGHHKVMLTLDDETIEISHKALSRNLYAKGALHACQYLSKKDKGLYTSIYD